MFKFLNHHFILPFVLSALALGACASAPQTEVPTAAELNLTQEAYIELQNEVITLEQAVVQADELGELKLMSLVELARAYETLGQLEKAIQTYETYSEITHDSKITLNNLAHLYEKAEDYDQSIQYFQKLIDDHKDKGYLLNISRVYIKMENLQQAENYYQQWHAFSGEESLMTESLLERLKKDKI